MKKIIYKIYIIVFMLSMNTIIQACVILLHNDTQKPIVIKQNNVHNHQKITIQPDSTATIGSEKDRAHFRVYTQYAKNRSTSYHHVCTVMQHACSMGKKIKLEATDILNNNIDHSLFSITPPA